MWGDASDLAIWTRLSLRGTFADFWKGTPKTRRWVYRKGIHLHDRSREAVSAGPLRSLRHVPITALKAGSPVLHANLLAPWPQSQNTVVGLNSEVLAVFDGPRVLFRDGFSKEEQNVRAVYYAGPATFTHSIGVIAGKPADAELLQFAAVYLRSSLAKYFLMMRGWKMLCERNGVHLADVASFPFFEPKDAPDPEVAKTALTAVARHVATISELPELSQRSHYTQIHERLDDEIFRYFGLTLKEQELVRETVDILLPSVRPRSFKSLDTEAQAAAEKRDLKTYSRALAESLTSWRTRSQGRGRFSVEVVASDHRREGPSGIVRITYTSEPTAPPIFDATVNDLLVVETLAGLRARGLRVIPAGDSISLVPMVGILLDPEPDVVPPIRTALSNATVASPLNLRRSAAGLPYTQPSALFGAADFDTEHDRDPAIAPHGRIRVSHFFFVFGYPTTTRKPQKGPARKNSNP